MDPLLARYPYFEAARRAVGSADVSPSALVAEDAPAVERGLERVERAVMEGVVDAADPDRWRPRDELLSYPIARILVSLVDEPAAVEKYAAAEAATARERFTADFEADDDGLQSVSTPRVEREAFLREFDLEEAVETTADRNRRAGRADERIHVAVDAYLRLANPNWGDRWRLVNRELADGVVRVDREELHRLLGEAVRQRVAAGLPFDVQAGTTGTSIADALEDEVEALRDLLADRDDLPNVDAVVPGQFPPCIRALVERARDGGDLPDSSRFALLSFLVAIGADDETVTQLTGLEDDRTDYATTVLRDGDGTQYPPPSCETMQENDDCVNPDDRCETISNPLAYYGAALADADEPATRP